MAIRIKPEVRVGVDVGGLLPSRRRQREEEREQRKLERELTTERLESERERRRLAKAAERREERTGARQGDGSNWRISRGRGLLEDTYDSKCRCDYESDHRCSAFRGRGKPWATRSAVKLRPHSSFVNIA